MHYVVMVMAGEGDRGKGYRTRQQALSELGGLGSPTMAQHAHPAPPWAETYLSRPHLPHW